MADKKPADAAQPLTDQRKAQIAQHYFTAPLDVQPAILAHFKNNAPPEEVAYLEQRIAESRKG